MISNLGANPCFLSSLRISRTAARVSRRRWMSMSNTSPWWWTARRRYIRSPGSRTTVSSRCQRSLGRGRRWRSRRAIAGPNFQHPAPHRFVGDVEPALGQEFLDIAVAQGEAEIEPDRVLDDLGREPMAAIAGQGHADILPYSAHPPPF